jgi:DNA-binding transcriptional ArsR family regulator
MKAKRSPSTDDLFIALGHPIRRQILRKLMRKDTELSPRELADRLDQPLGKLSYHVRILAQHGTIELVRTRQIRGSTQHFYRSVIETKWARSALRSPDPAPG